MRQPVYGTKLAPWLLGAVMAILLLGPAMAWGEVLTVIQPNQSLYPEPDFASTTVGTVPEGSRVQVLRQAGDWYKVDYHGMQGWLHRQAFPAPKPQSGFNLPGLLFGAPVKETTSDEVALAGKGFTPEVESAYRQKHPEMNFAQVEQVETFRVAPAKLDAFIREGGLNP